MHTRAEHWISIGMITSICSLDEAYLAAVNDMGNPSVQVDRDLMEYLKTYPEPVGDIMTYHINHMGNPPQSNALDPILNIRPHKNANGVEVYVYTVPFHSIRQAL